MQAKNNTVVWFHYVLKDDNASVIDSSEEGEAVSFILGHNQILQGLEDSIREKKPGEGFSVTIPPEKAYGLRDDSKIKILDRAFFGEETVFIGMQFNMRSEADSLQYETMIVIDITQDKVTIDSNHVMAGARLNFEIRVIDVRPATASEISTGNIEAKDPDIDMKINDGNTIKEDNQEKKIKLISC